MKFCPNCGAELKPEAKFCTTCGTPVAVVSPPSFEPVPEPQPSYRQEEPVYDQAKEASSTFKEAISGKTNLVQRVFNIITKPKEEWEVIAYEQPNTIKLIGGYTLILALIPAISAFLRIGVIEFYSYQSNGIMYGIKQFLHFGIGSYSYLSVGVMQGLIQLISAVVGVYLLAWVIDQLAPSFDSEKNFGRSLQLAVYASTPQWVAGILLLLSTSLSMLILLIGLYAIYLFAIGFPVLKKTPKDKVAGYVALTIIAMIVIHLVLSMILTAILGFLF